MLFEEWDHTLRNACGHYYGMPEKGQRDTNGHFRVSRFAGLDVANLSCDIRGIERTREGIRRDESEHIYMLLQISGKSYVEHLEMQTVLSVGDICLLDSTRPAIMRFDGEASHYVSVHLPRGLMLLESEPDLRIGRKLGRDSPAAQRLARYFQTDARGSRRAPDNPYGILELARLAFAANFDAAPGLMSLARNRFDLAVREIESKLASPDLSFGWLARQLGISERQLSRDFLDNNTSFVRTLRDRRLRLAAEMVDLAVRQDQIPSVTMIAFECGFRDLSNFTRAFRKKFECTPRDYIATRRKIYQGQDFGKGAVPVNSF